LRPKVPAIPGVTRDCSTSSWLYPDFLASHDENTLIWKDGTAMTFDDGEGEKDFDTRLDHPDIEDMFYVAYPVGRTGIPPGVGIDPGRVRYEPFFDKMYGNCTKGQVKSKLVPIVCLPKHGAKKIKITSVNGVNEKLQAVSDELDKLPDSFVKYLTPSGGTYNCRVIAGTTRKGTASLSTSMSAGRTIGAITSRSTANILTRTASHGRSSKSSRSTASSGATTPCISRPELLP
jgi:hypothetical protein